MPTLTPKPVITAAKVRSAIAALGTSPRAMALSLKKLGIKGIQGLATSCPLAGYINKKLLWGAGGYWCEVGMGYVWVYEFQVEKPVVKFEGSRVAQKFVELFDNGKYPFLVAE